MTPKFYNIFSGKKPKKIFKKKIIVDHREKSSLVVEELEDLGFDLVFSQLKVADYIIKGVAIERKTVNDFISSMISKRLLRQLKDLQQYPKRLLIVEGIDEQDLYAKDSEYEIGMHPNAVRGFLLSILLTYNVPIIFTRDYQDTARFISVLAKKKKSEMPLNVNKKNLNESERLQFILEGFPGVGPKTSRKLLDRFGSLKNISTATELELREAIGKKSEAVFALLNYEIKPQ